jgi:hypothetical protein
MTRSMPAQPSEKQIHAAVIAHWRAFGVPGSLVATIPNMRAFGQAGLTKGLGDLIVLSPTLGDRTGFLELKKVGGHLSEDQADFGQLCFMRGIPWAVTYGRDEPIKVLEEWGAVKPTGAMQ